MAYAKKVDFNCRPTISCSLKSAIYCLHTLPYLIAGSDAISKLFVFVPTHPIFIPAYQLGIQIPNNFDGFAISSWAFYEEHCQVALVVEIITKKLQIVAQISYVVV